MSSLPKPNWVKRLHKRPWYNRLRRSLPGWQDVAGDDSSIIDCADRVFIDWPKDLEKPRFGLIRETDHYPRWTKFRRFLETNRFDFDFYEIERHDWFEKAKQFDIIAGFWSCELHALQQMREKYWILEDCLGKSTYPSPAHAILYEDKKVEAYIAAAKGLPFARTFVSYCREDAMKLVDTLPYPVVSKIIPSSASVGVELVRDAQHARRIVRQAFSPWGRATHRTYERQKNYVYFQEFIPNDGFDIRTLVIGNRVFGYYRRVLPGDFRASGMSTVEIREVPVSAMRVALEFNAVIKSPMLVVDMVRGHDERYHIIEFSPFCQIRYPGETPSMCIFSEDGSFVKQESNYWLHELSLREFLLADYLPKIRWRSSRNGTTELHESEFAV